MAAASGALVVEYRPPTRPSSERVRRGSRMGPAAVPWTQKLAPAENSRLGPRPWSPRRWTAVGARMTTLAPATTPSPTTRRISGRQLASELGRGGADDHMDWDSERWQRPFTANEDAPRAARPRWPGVVSGTINKHYIPYRDQPTHSPNRCQTGPGHAGGEAAGAPKQSLTNATRATTARPAARVPPHTRPTPSASQRPL